jgi:HSP20 family protein
MFGLTPYERWQNSIQKKGDTWDVDKMFDSMFEEFCNRSKFPSFLSMNSGDMKVDIKEGEKEFILEAELPGVDKNNINLELKDDVLTVSVERNEEVNEDKENYIRKERRYGSMSRSFYVDDINTDEIKAKFENGILYVTLPKLESKVSKNNKIQIE